MPGPPPDDNRVRRAAPDRPWRYATAPGWQHGRTPPPPNDLTDAALDAWHAWFTSWWAAFWSPADVPGLRQVVRLLDEVERGRFVRAAELRQAMDGFGLTPKGRQSLRWRPPQDADVKPRTGPRGRLSAKDRMRIMQAGEAAPNGNGVA